MSQQSATLARKYIGRLLKDAGKAETRTKMKDPHLLLHISALMDEISLDLLCKYVGASAVGRMPGKVAMSLDILKISFDEISMENDDDQC